MDVYSYAIILWEIHARKLPFDEYAHLYKFLPDYEDAIARENLRPTIPAHCSKRFAKLIKQVNPNTYACT